LISRKCRQDVSCTVVVVVDNPVLVPKRKRRTAKVNNDSGFEVCTTAHVVQDLETAAQTTEACLLKPQIPSAELVMAVPPNW
jgi:hypothetical protein